MHSGGADDELIEGPLRVEHHRRQRPATRRQTPELHRARLVAERLEPHGVCEPFGRVDGEHERAAAERSSAQRQRGRGGGLSDAARAHTDEQFRLGKHAIADVPLAHACSINRPATCSTRSRSLAFEKTKGVSKSGIESSVRSRASCSRSCSVQ